MEMIIVLTILLALISLLVFGFRSQIYKGNDTKRKDDLERIRIAFEDYYNDYHCYPDVTVLGNCDGNDLDPYLKKIPCDPMTKQPYKVVCGLTEDGGCRIWYQVYAKLEYGDDPVVKRMGLTEGKTIDGETFNYGVSSPNTFIGNLPEATFICPGTGAIARGKTTCANPADYLSVCETCGCNDGERIVLIRGGYYCCFDKDC